MAEESIRTIPGGGVGRTSGMWLLPLAASLLAVIGTFTVVLHEYRSHEEAESRRLDTDLSKMSQWITLHLNADRERLRAMAIDFEHRRPSEGEIDLVLSRFIGDHSYAHSISHMEIDPASIRTLPEDRAVPGPLIERLHDPAFRERAQGLGVDGAVFLLAYDADDRALLITCVRIGRESNETGALMASYSMNEFLPAILPAELWNRYALQITDQQDRTLYRDARLTGTDTTTLKQTDLLDKLRLGLVYVGNDLAANIWPPIIACVLLIAMFWTIWGQWLTLGRARRAGALLEESEESFRALIESVNDVALAQDHEGVVTYISPVVEMLSGYRPEEVIGRRFDEFIHPEDAERLRRDFEKVTGGQVEPSEYRIITRSRGPVWVRSSSRPIVEEGRVVGLRGVITDISDIKAAEELREREAGILRAVVDSVAEGIVVADSEGRFTLFNRAAREILGLGPVDAIPEHWPGVYQVHLAGDDEPCAAEDLPLVRAIRGESVDGVELEIRREPDVPGIALLGTARPVRAGDGTTLGGVVVFRDVTAIRREQQRVHVRQANLAQFERLRTLAEITAGLAHELNQPLCALVNYSEALIRMMDSDSADSKVIREMLEEISKQATRCGRIMHRMQDLAQRKPVAAGPVDLSEAVREVAQIMRADLRDAGIRLEVNLDTPTPHLRGDRVQVEQVLLNLMRNAVDAVSGSEPGRRMIRISARERDERMIEVHISDSGVGVPSGRESDVFDAFFTTKRNGMGLGLAISRTIIEQCGGRIWCRVDEPCGSTFGFTMPRYEGDTSGATESVRG